MSRVVRKAGTNTALFLLLIVIVGSIAANPVVIDETAVEEGGEIYPETETPLVLKSENVTFNIGKTVKAEGRYIIYNPTNDTVSQMIMFPIYTYAYYTYQMPGDFKIESIHINQDGVDNISGVFSGRLEGFHDYYHGVLFNISIPPLNDTMLKIKWDQNYAVESATYAKLNYITQTARKWSRPVEYAFFEFVFEDLYILGEPDGGDGVVQREGKVVTSIEHTNWVPEEDIEITWHPLSQYFNFGGSYYEFYFEAGPIRDEDGRVITDARVSVVDRNNERLKLRDGEGPGAVEHVNTDSDGIARFGLSLRKEDHPDQENLSKELGLELVVEKNGYYVSSMEIELEEKTFVAKDMVLEAKPDNQGSFLPGFTSFTFIIALFIVILIVKHRKC